MPVSVNKLTVNTQVNKDGSGGGDKGDGNKGASGTMNQIEREELIQECLDRVREYLEYEFHA